MLLQQRTNGNDQALAELMPLAYDELRRMAGRFMAQVLLDAPEQAETLLAQYAKQHPAEYDEVASLYQAFCASDDFMETPVAAARSAETIGEVFAIPPTLPEGEECFGYKVRHLLGKGSMAHVYDAIDTELLRPVAIKVSWNKGDEARTLAKLEHSHIVRVFGQHLVRSGKVRLVVMQRIEGLTLEALVEKLTQLDTGSLPQKMEQVMSGHPAVSSLVPTLLQRGAGYSVAEFICYLGETLADALQYAHGQGVLHLDIKPANILVDSRVRPYLSDFNISGNSLSDAEQVVGGTLAYMSPEHKEVFAGKKEVSDLDGRSDIYSLQATLWESYRRLENKPESLTPQQAFQEADFCHRPFYWLFDWGTRTKRAERPSSAGHLGEGLRFCRQLAPVLKNLPLPWHEKFGVHPMVLVAFCILLPQVFGSAINISYNASQIIS